jgi:hypothetical protein
MSHLPRLAELLRARNTVANLLGESVSLSTVGESLATDIFGLTRLPPTSEREATCVFAHQPLTGKTVVVQWYPRREGFLNLRPESAPDYYLVLAGPKQESSTTRALVNPWIIRSVHLFHTQELLAALRERGVQIGSHTSVISPLWERSEIFPFPHNPALLLTDEQRALIQLFG